MKPWLYLPASISQKLFSVGIKLYSFFCSKKPLKWNKLEWKGLSFPNPLGIAGGVDKNATLLKQWPHLGCGFVEVGTVTPLSQTANAGKIIARNNKALSLWNHMGFPNKGLDNLQKQLKKNIPYPIPLLINVGKNRSTPLQQAHKDYIKCMHQLQDYADIFVINISSPNTESLRELFLKDNLKSFLQNCLQNKTKPTLLKISPDLSQKELEYVLDVSCLLSIDGWVVSNTMQSLNEKLHFPLHKGGVSGLALAQKAKLQLQHTIEYLTKIQQRKGKLLISVGGISSALDIKERLNMGADLVQVYSALVFQGPSFFKKIDKNIKKPLL
ncbi:MAG: quinone-dependent dihydroorotate dehydrogenase [Bdellovibrionaceae bacterium]|nr:quinone-dependent dihydroorotate dehydrogenase [Pseudobdellovibrionaceae bacterium]